MKNIYLIASFSLLAAPAFAAGKTNCVNPESFKEKIYNCGQNKVAVKMANLCAGEVRARMAKTGAELNSSMTALQAQAKDARQAKAMTDAIGRLDTALVELADGIADMQKNTALIATYNDVMIDDQTSEDEEHSPECFNKNHDALQDLVDALDDEIVQGKKAYAKAEAMATSLDKANVSMDSLTPSSPAASAPANSTPVATPKNKKPHGSDISGTEEQKKAH